MTSEAKEREAGGSSPEAKRRKCGGSSQAAVLKSLFSSWLNTSMTLSYAGVVLWFGPDLLRWLFTDASFSGSSRADCALGGACWTFIGVWFDQILYGRFPPAQHWRVNVVLVVLAISLACLLTRRRLVHYGLAIAYVGLPLAFALLMGGEILGLASTSADLLGGLTLNVLLSAGAALLSFPLGVMLALARRSEMPVFRYLAAVYIEFWRGVPLITVLFTALILLPMFLSSSISLGTFPRAFLALVVVYAAYMAEVIRGGLQAVPEGQLEAARSLGLGYWRCHVLVILPQAIRAVLPAIVNTIIELLKDSTLVYMIGLFDVLGVLSLALRETQWIGLSTEAYVFVAIVYFAMSRGISWAGGLLERRSTA